MWIMISSRSGEIKTDESCFQLRWVNAAINEKWLERFDAAILKSAWKGRIQKGNHFQMWKHPQLVFWRQNTHNNPIFALKTHHSRQVLEFICTPSWKQAKHHFIAFVKLDQKSIRQTGDDDITYVTWIYPMTLPEWIQNNL